MFYFTCNESKIYESFTIWIKLQEKMNFFHDILIYWDAPVYTYIRGVKLSSWRARDLQSLAPTLIKHTWSS